MVKAARMEDERDLARLADTAVVSANFTCASVCEKEGACVSANG